MLALPGSAYLYAGEELGLPEAHVPDHAKRDPIFFRSGGRRSGRDGCRIPMPWHDSATDLGFSAPGSASSWLPVPAEWHHYAVDRQDQDPESTLNLYREALRLRALHPALGAGRATLTRDGDVLRLDLSQPTGEAVTCWINMGPAPVAIPAGRLLLGSRPEVEAPAADTMKLPGDTAVWVQS